MAAPASEDFRLDPEFIRDLFAQFRPVTIKRMFSGAGIFANGLMFGLIVRDVIYLKADETSIADFEREGSEPFTYTRGKSTGRPRRHALPYWRLPERLYDDPDELAVWGDACFCDRRAEETCGAGEEQAQVGAQLIYKKLCGSTSMSSLIEPGFFGAAASHSRT